MFSIQTLLVFKLQMHEANARGRDYGALERHDIHDVWNETCHYFIVLLNQDDFWM